jgi:hypothetical protein
MDQAAHALSPSLSCRHLLFQLFIRFIEPVLFSFYLAIGNLPVASFPNSEDLNFIMHQAQDTRMEQSAPANPAVQEELYGATHEAEGTPQVQDKKKAEEMQKEYDMSVRIVQKLSFDVKFSEFKIQNIVGSCDVKPPIRLEGLAYSTPSRT